MVKHRIRDSIHQMSKVYITRWMLFLLLKPRNVIWSGNDICSFQQTEESLLMSFSKQNLCVGLDTFWTISGRLGGEKKRGHFPSIGMPNSPLRSNKRGVPTFNEQGPTDRPTVGLVM